MIEVSLPEYQLSQLDDPDFQLAHLEQAANVEESRTPHQRIYVLENLTLSHIALFGTFFNIDPCVFASQIRTADWEEKPTENNTPKLLSCRNPSCSFYLRYNELRLFRDPVSAIPQGLFDTHAGRRIIPTLGHPLFANVGLVRRCAKFWCRETPKSGWDGTFITPSTSLTLQF